MANKQQNPVAKVYQTVIDDVISNVRESFLDDGVDEQVLQELKQIWESKLAQTKAVDSPVMGDRTPRPQMYTYMAQPNQAGQSGQSVMYQTVPAQLSAASQQARLAIPDGVVYQQGPNIVLPTQGQQIYHAPYQPVVLQQPNRQIAQRLPGQTQTIVLTSASQPGVSGQQATSSGKSNPSAIIQVDGSKDGLSDDEISSSSISSNLISKSNVKLFPQKKKYQTRRKKLDKKVILQVDGGIDSSSSDEGVEDDDDDDEDDDDEEEEDTQEEEEEKVDEEPLCSADDDSDQDASELFDTDNVVVCQYDKIHRAKAKWKFNLKVGIMNLKGKDHVFLKANGEADW